MLMNSVILAISGQDALRPLGIEFRHYANSVCDHEYCISVLFLLGRLYLSGWCGSKNGHQKDMFLNEVGTCAQNMITILSSIVNMIGGRRGGDLYHHVMSMRIFALLMNKIFI